METEKIAFTMVLILGLCRIGACQVIDVNGDSQVGPHEAIAVSEQWKGPAVEANDHNHLGQTWRPDDEGRPLSIRGDFPDRGIVIPFKNHKQIFNSIPSAPLILENTSTNGSDLLLGGTLGIIRAVEEGESTLVLRANRDITVFLNEDGTGTPGVFAVRTNTGSLRGSISEAGDLGIARNANIGGNLDVQGDINGMKLDASHKKSRDVLDSFVIAGERPMHVFSGKVELDEEGEAEVQLPSGVSDSFDDFLYQLTPIGDPAPNLHIAEEIDEARFRISGGVPGKSVCWQVTGI